MISVLIPHRGDSDRRSQLFAWVQARYRLLFPDAEVVIGVNSEAPFNRSAARNEAFSRSTGDVLVIADADVMCDPRALWAAVELVTGQRRWVVPYTTYYNLDQATSDAILESSPDVTFPSETAIGYEHRIPDAVAGQLVMPREAFVAVNGYDERYKGWGYEDTDFAIALDTLWAPVDRLPGHCLHLWHELGDSCFEQPSIRENQALHRQYLSRRGRHDQMREWVHARHL